MRADGSGDATSSWARRSCSISSSSSMERVHTSNRSGHSLLRCPIFPQWKQDIVGMAFLHAASMSMGMGFPGVRVRWEQGAEGVDSVLKNSEMNRQKSYGQCPI